MENVKGRRSAAVGGERVFDMILEDLRSIEGKTNDQYHLVPLSPASLLADDPGDFLVQAEERSHSGATGLLLSALRPRRRPAVPRYADCLPRLRQVERQTTVRDVIGGFPALRSGLSREPDHRRDVASRGVGRGRIPQ